MLRADFHRLAAEAHQTQAIRLARALTRLPNTLAFMQTGAHPDDETSGLLALLSFRDGVRTSYACSTRGEGGQNAIGPHKGLDLAMIRTREMEAAAVEIGCALYWFGEGLEDGAPDFRFSRSGEETLARWSRDRILEQMVRIVRQERPDAMCPTFLDVGGQHGHHRAMTRIAREAYEIAGDPAAFPQHAQLGLKPWSAAKFYLPAWSGAGDSYDDEAPPPPATTAFDVGEIDALTGAPYARIGEWSRRFHATQNMGRWIEAAPLPRPLHLAASRVSAPAAPERNLGDGLPATLRDWAQAPDAPAALTALAHAVDDALTAPAFSQAMLLHLSAARGHADAARRDCPPALADGLLHRLERKIREIDAALVLAQDDGSANGTAGAATPVHEHATTMSVSLWPDKVMLNAARGQRRVSAALHIEGADEAAIAALSVQGLAGVGVEIYRAGASANGPPLRLDVSVVPEQLRGAVELAVMNGAEPAQQTIEAQTPHLGRITRRAPVVLRLNTVDCALAPDAPIAYLGGGHDNVGRRLAEIGADVREIADGGLDAFDLSRVRTVLIGIFAFGMRRDLSGAAERLHGFVRAGGNLVTLYHRPGDGWDPERTPLAPLIIGSPSLRFRVTDEAAEVRHLQPEHHLLNWPNRIAEADWSDWRKERGLYFASRWDERYTPLLSMADPGEQPLRGALLTGQFGAGRHTHVALALHTEMENLVPGAYRIMANLVAPA